MNLEQDLTPPAPPSPPPPPVQWELPASPPEPPPRARWPLPRSLTARLVTGVVSLVVVIVLGVGTSTYFALRSFLYDRLNRQVDAAVQAAASTACGPGWLRGEVNCTVIGTGEHEWIGVLTPQGESLNPASSEPNSGFSYLTLPRSLGRQVVAHPGYSYSYTTSDGVELRLEGAAKDGPFGSYVVVVGLSTHEVRNTLRHLVDLELLIGAAAVVVAFGATAWGVRFSLRRLHEVTDTAQEVAAELSPEGAGLDRRVSVDEEGTEVGRLAHSMNTLLSAVETQFAARLESERRMRQFLADASHELRTPLTSIRGYAELARMQRAHGQDEESADNLARIESEGTRMSRLVEDLLTLARGDQGGAPEMGPVDVDDLLDEVVSGARAAFPHRLIDQGPATGITVIGDQDQLLRAVRNLVSNAATHTDPAGPIGVRAFVSGPGVALQVSDQGPGLPPEEAAHVFERFWRADKARTRSRGGSGLGLAIVASIVQQHGGTVHFDSTVEHGSTVTIWLPARISSP